MIGSRDWCDGDCVFRYVEFAFPEMDFVGCNLPLLTGLVSMYPLWLGPTHMGRLSQPDSIRTFSTFPSALQVFILVIVSNTNAKNGEMKRSLGSAKHYM